MWAGEDDHRLCNHVCVCFVWCVSWQGRSPAVLPCLCVFCLPCLCVFCLECQLCLCRWACRGRTCSLTKTITGCVIMCVHGLFGVPVAFYLGGHVSIVRVV